MLKSIRLLIRGSVLAVYLVFLACSSGGGDPCSNEVRDTNEADVDCGGTSFCWRCKVGSHCTETSDCSDQMYCASGVCTAATCEDGVKNRDESDVDCGGHFCARCLGGKACTKSDDCDSQSCASGVCGSGTCTDNVKDQGESDTDCGGLTSCERCPNEKSCSAGTDCASGVCGRMRTCADFNCVDELKNADETDVDCGGANCSRCHEGQHCNSTTDCDTNACVNGLCATIDLCEDQQQDNGESDVDCGGLCAPCEAGAHCEVLSDCDSYKCVDHLCTAPSCDDHFQNGGEPDVDCGGPCSPCPNGSLCFSNNDCAEQACGIVNGAQICLGPNCMDFMHNGSESDVDCGGTCPNRCDGGRACISASDCASSFDCVNHICARPTCSDNAMNGTEIDVDCGGTCPQCRVGKHCENNGHCLSNYCNVTTQLCALPTCSDHVKNGQETDVDCGGITCNACDDTLVCLGNTDCHSNYCNGHCTAASCSDGIQNGFETGVDCGGGCAGCAVGSICHAHADCASGTCSYYGNSAMVGRFRCVASSCTTGTWQDATETDVNCGGSCAAKCAEGAGCLTTSDCSAGLVCSRNLCLQAQCGNATKDANEVGVDCGGPCRACDIDALSMSCTIGDDCLSGYCAEGAVCAPQDVLLTFSWPIDNHAIANTEEFQVYFNQPMDPATLVGCYGRDVPTGCNVLLQDSGGGFVPVWVARPRATPPFVSRFVIGHPVLLDIVHMNGDYKLTIIGGDHGPRGVGGSTAPSDMLIGFRCSSG